MKSLKIFSRISFIITLFSAFLIITSCTSKKEEVNPVTQGANEIWIQNMAFSPASKIISVGTTIKWTNKDFIAHTVVSTTNVFSSNALNQGDSFSFTFSAAGTYNYICSIHPSMTATIIVQ